MIKYYHKEWKPTLYNIFTPLMKAIGGLGIKPNHLTAMQFPFSAAMCVSLIYGKVSIAILCMVFALMLDGMDGLLARSTNQETRRGHVFDKSADIFGIVMMLVGIAIGFPGSLGLCVSLGVINIMLYVTNEIKEPFFYTAARDAGVIGLLGFTLMGNIMFLNAWLFISISIGTFLFLKKSMVLLGDLGLR